MKLTSPILQLAEILSEVREKANEYRDILERNEAQTRATLIDPILSGLGWDDSNPKMIKVELIYEGTILDYGLVAANGRVCYIVEAKKYRTNLNDQRIYGTAIRYAFNNRVPYVVVTDGIQWHFYDDFTPGNTIPDVVDLSQGSLSTNAIGLIKRLDIGNFGYPDELVIQENLEIQVTTVAPPQPHMQTPARQDNPGFITFDQLNQNLAHHLAPNSMRLPDGAVVPLTHWSDVVFELTKFVLGKLPNIQIPIIDQAGRRVNLVSYIRPDSRHEVFHFGGREIFIHTNYSATNCVKNARYIWEKLPVAQRGNMPALSFE